MATIECPRCETTFESQATTATRCRSCRSVVHVSAGRGRARSATHRATTTWSMEPADDAGDKLVVVGLVLAVAVGVGIYLYVRARRKRKAAEAEQEPSSAPCDPS